MFRSLLQAWLQNAAKAKLGEAVAQTAKDRLAEPSAEAPAERPKVCHLGVVFALGIASGCFEDALRGIVTIRGNGFVVREGGAKGRRVVLIRSGPGRQNATRAAEALIDGHHPQRVISAGFAGGLSPELKRNDILIADRLLTPQGDEVLLELSGGLSASLAQPGVHCGPLLTNDSIVQLPGDKQALFQRWGAMAVDMETFAVAEVCLQRGTPFSAIRVITDTADEALPHDVEHLLAQKGGARQWGAAVGTIWRRPASAKELYQLRENALVASQRLARFLVQNSVD